MLGKGPQLESNVVHAASGTLDAIVARPVHALIGLDVVLVADVAKHDLWARALRREARAGNNFATSPGVPPSVPFTSSTPDRHVASDRYPRPDGPPLPPRRRRSRPERCRLRC